MRNWKINASEKETLEIWKRKVMGKINERREKGGSRREQKEKRGGNETGEARRKK